MPDTFVVFNLIEGVFWIACSLFLLFGPRRIRHLPDGYWRIASLLLFLFGVSDFVEAYSSPSFVEPGGYWLLVWKAACVIGLVLCIVWYLSRRLRPKQNP
jgi:hypothetical protein